MDALELSTQTLQLRYEAFSRLASDLNKAVAFDQLGTVLAHHVKLVLDAFRWRMAFFSPSDCHLPVFPRRVQL